MNPYPALVSAMTRHRGVLACMVVMEDDGILVDATAQIGVDTAAFAALTASLYRKAARAASAAGFGGVSFCELEAERGRVIAAGRNGLVIIAVAEPKVNLGLLRIELLRAAGGL